MAHSRKCHVTRVMRGFMSARWLCHVTDSFGYKCCSKKIVEHPLNDEDLHRINQIQLKLTDWEGTYPDLPLPDGVNLGQPKRHGLDSIDKFYTARNLIANAAIWKEIRKIEDSDVAMAAAFAFTSLYQRVTRMSEVIRLGQGAVSVHVRSSLMRALARITSLRMMAAMASLAGFPASTRVR